jgi:hypothetical protein
MLTVEQIHAIIICDTTLIRVRLVHCLEQLGITHTFTRDLQGVTSGRGVAYCMCPTAASRMRHIPPRSVVICHGAKVTDRLFLRLVRSGASVLDLDELTRARLLETLVEMTQAASTGTLALHLSGLGAGDTIPLDLVTRFLERPDKMWHLADVCRVLFLSRKAARNLVQACGFGRAEHLCTALRAEAWCWFARQGVCRDEYERFLGIADHRTFRRSCQRAGVPVPWQCPV